MQKFVLGVSPFLAAPFEVLLGGQLFPDWRQPRQIRDRAAYLFDQFGLGPEYRLLTGAPSRGYRSLASLVAYEGDPSQWAYSAIRDQVMSFGREQGKSMTGSTEPTERSTALYNLRLSLRFGDKESAELYLVEYMIAGGTAQGLQTSLRNMHPLSGLSSAEQRVFVSRLNDRELRQLAIAMEYYEDLLETFGSLRR